MCALCPNFCLAGATSSGSVMSMSPRTPTDRGRTTGDKNEPRAKSSLFSLRNMFRRNSRNASMSPVPSNDAVTHAQGFKFESGTYAGHGGPEPEVDGSANEAPAGGKASPAPGLISHRSTPLLATAALSQSGSSLGSGNATVGDSKWKFKKHLVLTQPSSPAHSFTSGSSRSSKSHSASVSIQTQPSYPVLETMLRNTAQQGTCFLPTLGPSLQEGLKSYISFFRPTKKHAVPPQPLPMVMNSSNASAQRHQASYAFESSTHDLPSPYLRKLKPSSPGKVVLYKATSARSDMLSTPKKTAA